MNPIHPLSASRFPHTLLPTPAAHAAPSLHHTAILPHFIETPHPHLRILHEIPSRLDEIRPALRQAQGPARFTSRLPCPVSPN